MAKEKNIGGGKRRTFFNMQLTAVVSMSLVLFLIGMVGLLFLTASDITRQVKENLNVSIVLNDQMEKSYAGRIENYLKNSLYAKSTEYISKEKALEEHVKAMGENPQDFLGYNPLRASLEVKLNAAYANSDSIKVIERKLKTFDNIYKIVYQKDVMDIVNENIKKASIFLLGIALVLLFVSIALFNTTIRLMIYSNRFIINTMKLVGATPWFIRRPYIRRSMINGCIAALLSVVYLLALLYYVQFHFDIAFDVRHWIPFAIVSGGVIAVGTLLAALLSYFAVGRYLKMTTDKMYFV
jgi:cell division transport system permease protein